MRRLFLDGSWGLGAGRVRNLIMINAILDAAALISLRGLAPPLIALMLLSKHDYNADCSQRAREGSPPSVTHKGWARTTVTPYASMINSCVTLNIPYLK